MSTNIVINMVSKKLRPTQMNSFTKYQIFEHQYVFFTYAKEKKKQKSSWLYSIIYTKDKDRERERESTAHVSNRSRTQSALFTTFL